MGRNHPYLIGLTDSIGMGKSTVADFFALEGAAIWDADAAVHGLYGSNQPGSLAIAQLFPEAVGRDGVDRKELAVAIAADPSLLPRIEAAIHPLVAVDRQRFIDTCKSDIAGSAAIAAANIFRFTPSRPTASGTSAAIAREPG